MEAVNVQLTNKPETSLERWNYMASDFANYMGWILPSEYPELGTYVLDNFPIQLYPIPVQSHDLMEICSVHDCNIYTLRAKFRELIDQWSVNKIKIQHANALFGQPNIIGIKGTLIRLCLPEIVCNQKKTLQPTNQVVYLSLMVWLCKQGYRVPQDDADIYGQVNAYHYIHDTNYQKKCYELYNDTIELRKYITKLESQLSTKKTPQPITDEEEIILIPTTNDDEQILLKSKQNYNHCGHQIVYH